MLKLTLAFAAAALALASPHNLDKRWPDDNTPTEIISTKQGKVQGVHLNGVQAFKGIPFAAPPVGDLRWEPAFPPPTFTSTLNATKFSPACPQFAGAALPASYNEDCLYLNVFTPAPVNGRMKQGLSVGVWIFGGGFSTGDAGSFDPTDQVVEGDVIWVTVNYRLSSLGFIAYPGLSKAGAFNFAVSDHTMALKWVQDNIAAFGGRPDRVTIAGQSSGGASVVLQMISPASTGLFSQAIIQSFALESFLVLATPLETNYNKTIKLAGLLNCTVPAELVTCLRGKSAQEIIKVTAAAGNFGAVPGDFLVPVGSDVAIDTGKVRSVPILAGGNRNENRGSLSNAAASVNYTEAAYLTYLNTTYKTNATKVYAVFNSTKLPTPLIALAEAQEAGGLIAWCGIQGYLYGFKRLMGLNKLYAYEFRDQNAPYSNVAYHPPAHFSPAAYHGAEVSYVFDQATVHNTSFAFNAEQLTLGKVMRAYWTSFINTGDPSVQAAGRVIDGTVVPSWPKYTGDGNVLALNTASGQGVGIVQAKTEHFCDAMDPFLGL